MSFWKRFGQQEKEIGAVLLLAGFLAGIACVCFFPGLFVQNQGFLDTDTLSGISEWDMNRTGLFLYCLQKRLGTRCCSCCFALSGAGMICLIVLAAGSGLAAGMILTVLSLRYGIRGSFFFWRRWFHNRRCWFRYCMLLEWCLHKKAASGVWISLAVIGIGCAVEGYVNPFILKAVMRLFWGIGDAECQIKIWWNWYFPVPLSGIT